MNETASRITIDIQQIAEIAGVGRSAVGNWRKRHTDFPVPDSHGGFDLRQIERWLIESGKIDRPIPAEFVVWSLADKLRDALGSREITQFLMAALVYLETCDPLTHADGQRGIDLAVSASDSWNEVRETPLEGLGDAILAAATNLEGANPPLAGLLLPGLSKISGIRGDALLDLFNSLVAASDAGTPRFALFEEMVRRSRSLDRFRGESSTPDAVAELMARLGQRDAREICDPACGEGGLLLAAANHPDRAGRTAPQLLGFEINEGNVVTARSRFFLHGLTSSLQTRDVFRIPRNELPKSDLVVLDPPISQKDWGDADVYLDDRWTYGVPPRSNADLAWVQLALQCLVDGGRAIAVTGKGPTFRGGSEAQIRHGMLQAGVVEAVVQLPGRLRADTSIPLVMWLLQAPQPDVDSVLFIDASRLGSTGRSQHTFDESDFDQIVKAVRAARNGERLDPEVAWFGAVSDILDSDANLDLARYRPEDEVDIDGIRQRAEELRRAIPAISAESAQAVERLMAGLEEGQWR